MFSRRLSWSLKPNRLWRLLQEKRRAGVEILDLTESNPTRAELDCLGDEVLAALSCRDALAYDPEPHGLEVTRRAIARYYQDRDRQVLVEDIFVTAGTSEAYAFLFKILANPDDEILLPRPSYPLFEHVAALESLKTASYPLVYDGSWSIDLQSAPADAKAIVVVHPANPTGSYIKPNELEKLVELCRKRDLALIVDEVFLDYPICEDARRLGSLAGTEEILTFVLSGLSKVVGLPQMKLSWIAISGPRDLREKARERLEHVSDVFLSVGAPVQHAAPRFLELAPTIQGTIRERLRTNYRLLQEVTSGSPASPLRTEGGWYAVLRLPSLMSSEEWAIEVLSQDGIYVHPGYLFDFPIKSCLAVSLLTPPQRFRTGIERIVKNTNRRK